MAFTADSKGFTLVELVAVLVIIGIVGALGSTFVVSTFNSYNEVQERSKLIAKGRVVLEQITRQLRQALPNAVRVSSSGNCIEFMPLLGGANYIGPLPDETNASTVSTISTISSLPYVLASGTPAHVVVAALSSDEVFATGSPNSRVDVGDFSLLTSPYSDIPLDSAHRFSRNSISERAYITAAPLRFCYTGTTVVRYSAYDFDTNALGDSAPSGVGLLTSLMAQDVTTVGSSPVFSISGQGIDRNTAIDIRLNFIQGSNSVELQQRVLVRNVP